MRAELGRAVGTPRRRWLVAVTALLGLLAAVGMALSVPPEQLTFAAVAAPVQTLMSVTVPLFGIVLVHDLQRADLTGSIAPRLLAAQLLALVVAGFGVLLSVGTLALAAPGGGADRWRNTGLVVLGSVLVQSVAQWVGTGLGLLLRPRPPVVAFLATIVLPLGLWALLGAVEAVRPAQAWLTPFALAPILLSGRLSPLVWAQWLVMVCVWVVGLNAAGMLRVRRAGYG